MSKQCLQCGRRFYGTKEGSEAYGNHLDRHFRQNRRRGDHTRHLRTRGWYTTDLALQLVNEDQSMQPQVDTNALFGSVTTPLDSDTSRQAYKVVMGGASESHKVLSPGERQKCPICNEEFEEFWDDSEEEWMLRNAVEEQGKVVITFFCISEHFIDMFLQIYHATCKEGLNKKATENLDRQGSLSPSLKRKRDVVWNTALLNFIFDTC